MQLWLFLVYNLFYISYFTYLSISGQLIKWFQSYLSDRYQQVALQGTYSDWLQVLSGVPQGSILGPLLFLAYIDDIPQCIKHDSKAAIFAEDSKLFKIIEKHSDKFSLQQDLTQLSNWSDTWEMCLSLPKCKVLNISRKKLPTRRECHLDRTPLATVSEIKDLGCRHWQSPMVPTNKQISLKANRTLSLIRRICRDITDINTKKLLYCSIVRPQLEYACELIWSPYMSKDKLLNDAYEINHMWTADMKSNEEWSSQLWSQFLQLRKEAWK